MLTLKELVSNAMNELQSLLMEYSDEIREKWVTLDDDEAYFNYQIIEDWEGTIEDWLAEIEGF